MKTPYIKSTKDIIFGTQYQISDRQHKFDHRDIRNSMNRFPYHGRLKRIWKVWWRNPDENIRGW